jgi:molybdenum cofactor cytidylyltransferase
MDCVIAAAGSSLRMGSPKLLLPFGPPGVGGTIVETVVEAALEAGCRVIVVVGCRGGEVATALGGLGGGRGVFGSAAESGRLLVVENAAWEEGMLGSIQAGLGLVRGPSFFSMNADMPLVTAAAYRALARARDERNRTGLPEAALFAAHSGERGHPVLIPSAWIPEILGLPRGGNMKAFLASRPSDLVETGGDEVLTDIDRPEDYRRALERLRSEQLSREPHE